MAASLTQEQAARLAGVSVASWRRWERDPESVSPEVAAACEPVLARVPKRTPGSSTQFTIDLTGVPPIGEDDYIGFLQRASGGPLVFIQRAGEERGTLLAGDDGDWTAIPISNDWPLPLSDDRDRFWLGACWYHSSDRRPRPDPPATSPEQYMSGRPMPPAHNATCKHCQEPIQAMEHGDNTLVWNHTDDRRSRSCRAASWVPGTGWNESLDQRWKATPTK